MIDLDTIEQKLDYYVDHLYSSAYDDTYRTLDYDFTIDDFSDSYGDNFSVAHVKQGILEFFKIEKYAPRTIRFLPRCLSYMIQK